MKKISVTQKFELSITTLPDFDLSFLVIKQAEVEQSILLRSHQLKKVREVFSIPEIIEKEGE